MEELVEETVWTPVETVEAGPDVRVVEEKAQSVAAGVKKEAGVHAVVVQVAETLMRDCGPWGMAHSSCADTEEDTFEAPEAACHDSRPIAAKAADGSAVRDAAGGSCGNGEDSVSLGVGYKAPHAADVQGTWAY